MSTDTSHTAHDPTPRPAADQDEHDDHETDERPASDEESPPDDDLVVVVCPKHVRDRLQPELDEWREQLCRRYEREHEDLLAERAQLEDEVACLERQVERKEAQLDAVIARDEQILEERTRSYQRRIADGERDDVQWTGSRQEAGLLARLRSWLR